MHSLWPTSWQVPLDGEHDLPSSKPSAGNWLAAIVKVTLWNWQEVNDEI